MFLLELLINFLKVAKKISCYLQCILIPIVFLNWLLLVEEALSRVEEIKIERTKNCNLKIVLCARFGSAYTKLTILLYR